MRGELLIGGRMFRSDKGNRNMGRVRAPSPHFSLQICKICTNSLQNLYKFVQIICTICTKSFALYKAILYLTIATKIAILQTLHLFFAKLQAIYAKNMAPSGLG